MLLGVDKTDVQMNGADCTCHACIEKYGITLFGIPLDHVRMILCSECGNKRCPHASDHNHVCTGSNEPGQVGSVY